MNESRHDRHEREVREAHRGQAIGLLAWLILAGVLLALAVVVAQELGGGV